MLSITVTPKGEYDRYGDRLPDGAGRVIKGCFVAPATSRDITANSREGVEAVLTLYAPPGAVIGAHEQLRIEGFDGVWEVEGQGFSWQNPLTGWHPGFTVRIKKVTG
jgi:hypothetical protein